MSWLSRYTSKVSEEDSREARRRKLEADRLQRAEQRSQHRKSVEAAATARQEANEAFSELLALDPSIFEGPDPEDTSNVLQDIEELLAEDESDSSEPSSPTMADFETEDGKDEAKALQEALRNLQNYEWNQEDLLFYFGQIEIKMAAAGVKKQFTKFQVLSSIIPSHVINQVKKFLRKSETEFPNKDSYKQLKKEILRIF